MIVVNKNFVFGQLAKIIFSVFIASFIIFFIMSFNGASKSGLSALMASFFIITPLISLNTVVFAIPIILLIALPYNIYLLKENKRNWLYWIIPPSLLTPLYARFIFLQITNADFFSNKFLNSDNQLIFFILLGVFSGGICRYVSFEETKISKTAMVFIACGLIMLWAICSLFMQLPKNNLL